MAVAGSILYLCRPLRGPPTCNPIFVKHIFTFLLVLSHSLSYLHKILVLLHITSPNFAQIAYRRMSVHMSHHGFTQPTVFLGTLPDLPGYDIPYKPRFMITTSISLLLQLRSSYIILAQFKAVIYNQFCFYRSDLRLSAEFRHDPIHTIHCHDICCVYLLPHQEVEELEVRWRTYRYWICISLKHSRDQSLVVKKKLQGVCLVR